MALFAFFVCTLAVVFGSIAPYTLTEEYFRSPYDMLTLATIGLGAVAMASMVELLRRRVWGRIGATLPGLPRSWMLIAPAALLFPLLLAILDHAFKLPILDPDCASGQVADYFLLTIDSLAKGALVDFLESFRIDLHSCGFDKSSWWASAIEFTMRSFTTYIIIHILWQVASVSVRQRDVMFGG